MGELIVACPTCWNRNRFDEDRLPPKLHCGECGITLDFLHGVPPPEKDAPPDPVKNGRIDCPVCARPVRVAGVSAGARRRCGACAAPFRVPGPGEPVVCGGRDLNDGTDDEPGEDALNALGIIPAFEPLGGWAAQDKSVTLALRALAVRYARGHADPEEGRAAAAALARVLAWSEKSTEAGVPTVYPLSPEWTGDLIAHLPDTGLRAYFASGGPETAVVRLVIGREEEDGKSVERFLRFDLAKAPKGTVASTAHETASGRKLDCGRMEVERLEKIYAGLKAKMRPFACFKAVYGEWFTARHLADLKLRPFEAWLHTLSPRLIDESAVDALIDLK